MKKITVEGVDGREWELRRTVRWSREFARYDVEHDVGTGRAGLLLVLTALVLCWVVLLTWVPDGVHVPWWLWVHAALALAFLPVRWVLRRPVRIVAETEATDEYPPEYWSGEVRGFRAAREEWTIIQLYLRRAGTPGRADSPLQPVR